MPPLTRWYLKSSLLFLVLSMLMGALLAAQGPLNLSNAVRALNPVFFHLIMVGWVTQLIFGVAFWMFPKLSKEKPRGDEKLGWMVFWLLNLGLVLRMAGEPSMVFDSRPLWGWLVSISAVLQLAAGIIFVIITWGRVKER